MNIRSGLRGVALFLALCGAALLMGCAGMPARDVGMIAGAAVGAEGNPKRPVLGAVRGGALGYGVGILYENFVAPAVGGNRAYGIPPRAHGQPYGSEYRGRPRAQQGQQFGEGELTKCSTQTERDYRTPGSPETRVMTCESERIEATQGGMLKCSARYVERQTGGKLPEVTVDNERCRETVQVPMYRRY